MKSIRTLAAELADGTVTSRKLLDGCLEAIEDPAGEGSRAFLSVAADRARATADGYDAMRAAGASVPPFAGIPFAVKDLCDIEGEVSTAGSVVLADQPPAGRDAPVAARAKAAGFVIVGRTNMTEFAYSGLGLNAHYDTPRSPWDRQAGRIPGGSSSGTAVAVADGMAVAGLGTDTGGSCRIPAAYCGIVGYKPTARRVPLDGVVPLSFSLDSIGPMAGSVDCCAIVDDVFAGGSGMVDNFVRPAGSIRLGALSDLVLDGMDDTVAEGYRRALTALSNAGVTVVDVDFPELVEIPHLYRQGGLAAAEAFAWHQELLETRGDEYDQRVRIRIEPGGRASAAYYIEVLQGRRRLIDVAAKRMLGLDAFVLPTVPTVPPTIASFDDGDADYYSAQNLLSLRNTSIGNFLDACSISIPASGPGQPPVGVMLMAGPMDDRQLFEVARTVEHTITPGR
jgi:aspartyl-tRNA(Asn)/glutamyl-tRNA(Gln) amidotransferase subunit A